MSKKTSRAVWALAWAALIAALVYFNLPAGSAPVATAENPAVEAERFTSDAPLGYQAGEQLPDFTIATLGGEEFSLRAHRGQVTVINLWATWCAPCVKELPCFDQLQQNHPEDVAVLAIHSDLITDDPAAYLAGFDYQIPFAVDEGGQVIAGVGGSAMLPQTVVVNARGEVTYNRVGSVTYDALEELVQAARDSVSESVTAPGGGSPSP